MPRPDVGDSVRVRFDSGTRTCRIVHVSNRTFQVLVPGKDGKLKLVTRKWKRDFVDEKGD